MDKQQKTAKKLLAITKPLLSTATHDDKALMLTNTFRKDYYTLHTQLYLSFGSKKNELAFADSIAALSRRLLEDMVSILYIELKGIEKMTKRFLNFKPIEELRTLDFMLSIGIDVKEDRKERYSEYEKVKDDYMYDKSIVKRNHFKQVIKKLKENGISIDGSIEKKVMESINSNEVPSRNWAGKDIETMLKEVIKDGNLDEKTDHFLAELYLQGNYRNHFSPTGILNYNNPILLSKGARTSTQLHLSVSCLCLQIVASLLTGRIQNAALKQKIQSELDQLVIT